MSTNSHVVLKVLLIGGSNVGKTTAVRRFIDKKFVSQLHPTIGVDFALKNISLKFKSAIPTLDSVNLQIWDIAGEERFRAIIPSYIIGTQGLLLACDCTNPATLGQLNEYLEFITQYIDLTHLPIILISTKHDLQAMLTQEDIETFMHNHKIIHEYFPTSAATGLNINKTFQHIGRLIVKNLVSS